MKKPKIHWRLRRAIKQMVIEDHTDLDSFRLMEYEKNFTITGEALIKIVVKPGIKLNKWHRLARIKAYQEIQQIHKNIIESIIAERHKIK